MFDRIYINFRINSFNHTKIISALTFQINSVYIVRSLGGYLCGEDGEEQRTNERKKREERRIRESVQTRVCCLY